MSSIVKQLAEVYGGTWRWAAPYWRRDEDGAAVNYSMKVFGRPARVGDGSRIDPTPVPEIQVLGKVRDVTSEEVLGE